MSEVTQLPKTQLRDYVETVGEREIELIEALSDELKGKSVTHINSTVFGGGVAEILYDMVPSSGPQGWTLTGK